MRTVKFLLLLLLLLPASLQAAMDDYCSAPPFVSRSIAPNVMVMIDNSQQMSGPAYPYDAGDSSTHYSPTGTYPGYFKPNACYQYSSNKFTEGTANADGTCTTTAPFRGNLMNWVTMSRYDMLQKVLIGGNAVSKQGNAHTLLSISGTWSKSYGGCTFEINNGGVTIKDASTIGSCSLVLATPAPIAFLEEEPAGFRTWLAGIWDEWLARFLDGGKAVVAYVAESWDSFTLVAKAWAAQLEITPKSSLDGTAGVEYAITLEASGTNNAVFSWAFDPSPPAAWLTTGPSYNSQGQRTDYQVTWRGTPPAPGDYSFNATVSATGHASRTESFTIKIHAADLLINTTGLAAGEVGKAYNFQLNGQGGILDYTWAASGLPAGLSIDAGTGILAGTPTTSGSYEVTVTLTDSDSPASSVSKTFTLTVAAATGVNSKSFTVKVELVEEPLTDLNGNGIWDLGETYTDSNGNGVWDGKGGVFQKFWDTLRPRARWGLTKYKKVGGTLTVELDSCIPVNPASSFYTSIQNTTATEGASIASGLYGDLNYYGFSSSNFSSYNSTSYNGCGNSDPIDDVPCRKNFVLILTAGADVSGSAFASAAPCEQTDPLVRNACFGYRNDLRSDKAGFQNVYTYVVHMDTANESVLRAAASAGGGQYYPATDYAALEAQLIKALNDITDKAASGTAVSVLTTSSRGVGSMIQAYFLPTRMEETREVQWTGYTQNIWIDPQDNLREDTDGNFQLKQNIDKVIKLYFDNVTNETKAALFTTDADGNGGTLASCSGFETTVFEEVKYNWEGGEELAKQTSASRNLFTAKKVIRGASDTHDFSTPSDANAFTVTNVTGNDTLAAALDPDATYTAEGIVRYVRGECLETGVTGDNCAADAVNPWRDRRVMVDTTGNGVKDTLKVWKLGDIISSTPKVFANVALNTYHLDYGDSTYHAFISDATADTSYRNRSSFAFVGANDGVLHAFRVGYLNDNKDELDPDVKAKFQNTKTNHDFDLLGREVWGYIPFNAFPYLKYLGNPAYCHIYFNDLSVRLVDASLGDASASPTDTRTQSSWRSILIGGMRFGGACYNGTPAPPAGVSDVGFSAYYAIDITDPESPKPLWEFSDNDLGYSSSYPAVIRTGAKGHNGRWYVAVGSGSTQLPKNSPNILDMARSTTGYLYLLDLETGALVKKISLDNGDAITDDYHIVGDILAVDEDKDYHSEKIYFGTSYKQTAAGSWKGKLIRIDIPNQDLTDNTWTPVKKFLFDGTYPFTASLDAAKDTDGNVWVYGGSGKYYSEIDETDILGQIMLGFKDVSSGITYPLGQDDLTDQTNTPTTGNVTGTATACMYSPTSNTFEDRTFVTSTSATQAAAVGTGWRIMLANGERVITRPLAVGGLVDFLTYQPSANLCDYGGETFLYALGYTSGAAPANVAIRAPEATGGITSGPVTVAKKIPLGKGAPPTGEAIIVPPPKDDRLKKKIQIATGVIVEAENSPVFSVVSQIVHWLKK